MWMRKVAPLEQEGEDEGRPVVAPRVCIGDPAVYVTRTPSDRSPPSRPTCHAQPNKVLVRHERRVGARLEERLERLFDQDRHQAERHLVQEEQPRSADEGTGDRQYLLLATGQALSSLARPLPKPREQPVPCWPR